MNNQPQILIVDDEPTARDTLEAFLYPENYDLVFANNGSEALNRLQELAPDVILCDVMMPDMDGYEVCERIKINESWRHIPLILITALNSKEDVVRGLDAGAEEFLSKPINGVELRARVRSMLRIKKQYDQLAATMQFREDLAHMVAHDMRVPLTVILGFTELLLEETDAGPSNFADDIGQIQQQAQRLQDFINDLLTMAKLENDRLVLNCSMVDVNKLVLELQQSHQIIAKSRGINLMLEVSSRGQHQVNLDANLICRMLDNLLSNAFKFSKAGSTIRLQVEYPESQVSSQSTRSSVRLKVIDEGPGIPAQYRETIFDKFEILSSEKRKVSQFGLGLAFCKLVVEAHGGRIWVESNDPRGSIFVVEI
jgi:signal transduction histidine kinase